MVRPVPEIRLARDYQLIEYRPVEFKKQKTVKSSVQRAEPSRPAFPWNFDAEKIRNPANGK